MAKASIGGSILVSVVTTVVLTLTLGIMPCRQVIAIDSTWKVSASNGDWNHAANWSEGQIPIVAGDVARFPTPGATIGVSLPVDVSLGKLVFENTHGSVSVQGPSALIFDNHGSAAEIHFSNAISTASNAISAPISISGNNVLAVDIGQGKTLSIDGGIASPGGALIKRALGSLHLNGNNEGWSGQLIIDAGLVRIEREASVGDSNGGILVNPQGTLLLDRSVSLQSETIELAGGLLRAGEQLVHRPSMNGPVLVSANSRVESTGFFRINGSISGSGGLQFSGQRTVIHGDNSYAGVTTISAGRVEVHSTTGLGDALQGTIVESGGVLNIHALTLEPVSVRGGTLSFMTATSAAGPLTLHDGSIVLSRDADYTMPITLDQTTANAAIVGLGRRLSGGVVGSGNLILHGDLSANGAPLAHDGDLIIRNGDSQLIRLQSPNSFTGNLIIQSGDVALEHPRAGLRPAIVDGGRLQIGRSDIDFAQELRLVRGVVSNLGVISGPIELESSQGTRVLSGGRITGEISGEADISMESREENALNISGSNTFDGIAWIAYGDVNANSSTAFGTTNWATVVRRGTLNVNQATGELFYVQGEGVLNINAPIEKSPRFLAHSSFSLGRSRVAINAHSSFEDDVAVADGQLEVKANLSASALTVRNGGHVMVAPIASFELRDGEIDLREGRIEGKFTGAPVLRKTTYYGAELGDMPQFAGDIVVEEGLLEAFPGAFGTTAGVTRVQKDAQLMLRRVGTIGEDIFLENAAGPGNRGGLFVGGVCCGENINKITGRLHLGDEGSILGADGNGNQGELWVHSPVEGGDLITWGTGISVQLLNDNLYTGVTDVRQGHVVLRADGRLSLTSTIILHENFDHTDGTLTLDNSSDTGSIDRVDESIPVEFRGGDLRAFGGGAEAFGTLRFVEGHAGIDADSVIFSANRIERSAGATLFAELSDPMEISEVPTNFNGLIPWMTIRSGSSPDGGPYYELFGEVLDGQIRPLSRSTVVRDINATTASSNVGVPAAGRPVLTADRTINSLLVERDGIVDLAGHTLTVDSGGISAWGGSIRNGNLTAGAARELIFHMGATVGANIVDGPEGPVDVTLSSADLYGENTFTGRLVVNRSSDQEAAEFMNENSLPDGIDIALYGGHLLTAYDPTRARELGEVLIKGDGKFDSSSGEFSFVALHMEHGSVTVRKLQGDGPIRKTTIGFASIDVADRTDASYTGQIDVDEGLLNVVGLPAATYVVNGGRLKLLRGANSIQLNGGDLEFYQLSGPVEVTAPSTMIPTPQFNNPNTELEGPLTGSAKLTFNSSLQYLRHEIDPPARLSIDRDNRDFSGEVDIRLAAIGISRPQALGTGRITVFADGRLSVGNSSGDLFTIANAITLDGGQLRGSSQSRHTGELHVVSPSYVGGLELAGSLYFYNGVSLTTIGNQTTRFLGQMHVGKNAQLVLGRYEESDRGLVEIGGTLIAAETASTIDIQRGGLDELRFAASLHVPVNRTLEVRLDGEQMPLTLGVGQAVSGDGTVLNSTEFGAGSIVSPGASLGALQLQGSTIGGGAIYAWEFNHLGGEAGGSAGWDVLKVEGTLEFQATPQDPWHLSMVALPPIGTPVWPSEESTWVIAVADSIVGFDPHAVRIAKPATVGMPAGEFFLSEVDGRLLLNYSSDVLVGDFNDNGSVENADLTLVLNNWGKAIPPIPAEWSGDQPSGPAIDNNELTSLLNNWGNLLGSSGSVDGSVPKRARGPRLHQVPEPSTLALLAILALVSMSHPLSVCRGRR